MKPPAGYDQPRRKSVPRGKQVRLDLRPTKRPPSPEEEIERGQRSHFWKWFALVALFHLLVVVALIIFYRSRAIPPPPEPFISLMPEGDTVKGTPGAQAAPKVGATTPAPAAVHHHVKPKPVPPQPAVTPLPPAAVQPPPEPIAPSQQPVVLKPDAILPVEHKPKPAKPVPPKPKVKVDLHLVDGPATETEKPVVKPPKHVKKAPPKPILGDDQDISQAESSPENRGLSREQIAAKLGAKLDAAGVSNATKLGDSGATDGHANTFSDFYASIHDQVMNKWEEPNQEDAQATNPVVQIHVEKDGRVPAESVTLLTSSGNAAIDASALAAARSIGYTLEPLPDRCPPDISINFKLTH